MDAAHHWITADRLLAAVGPRERLLRTELRRICDTGQHELLENFGEIAAARAARGLE